MFVFNSVIELDHDGKFVRQFLLEAEVGCILVDGDALYAWCHPKNSYDKWKGALYGKWKGALYDKWKGALYGKITSKVINSIIMETTNAIAGSCSIILPPTSPPLYTPCT